MLTSALILLAGTAAAMPTYIEESKICETGLCAKPDMKYEQILDVQPGYQWNDAGGYCGSWSIQRATLSQGAWLSQQQVRDHTSPGGGHDNEILSTNIEEALKNLHLDFEGFDYVNTPVPQQDQYFRWLKMQLAQGRPVPWMIMWNGQNYPIYNLTPPAGMYGHVEPVIGIMSNHPLDDYTVYDDDVVVHFTDGGINTVYRTLSSLPGTWAGMGAPAKCGGGYDYCIGPYSFGWAIKGFTDGNNLATSAMLHIKPWEKEPDTRSGDKPIPIQGTLTCLNLEAGKMYDIYRWDSVKEAMNFYPQYVKTSFQASNTTYVYEDDASFQSDAACYYRCVAQ